jgi:HEAT repeat protein
VRAAALSALARLGAATEVDRKIAAADPSPVVRRTVAELAVQLGLTDCARLLDDPDPGVVEAACFAAGEIGDRAVVDRLATIARGHDDPLCRESAVAALGAIGAPEGLDAVIEALSDRPEVRRRAVVALSAYEGPRVTEALESRLTDRDWQVRQAAEDVLGISGSEPS